jgi:hypothetical protein
MLCRKCFDEMFLFLHSLVILLLRINIGVIVKDRNGKVIRQIFQYIAAAGCTATVKKKRWGLLREPMLFYDLFQFLLIVTFHSKIILLYLFPYHSGLWRSVS